MVSAAGDSRFFAEFLGGHFSTPYPWDFNRLSRFLLLRTKLRTILLMTTFTASKARNHLYRLLDGLREAHAPVLITGKRGNGVLIAEEDWSAIQETLYLLSIPKMRESIRRGMKVPIKKCNKKIKW